jgi:deoxycytidylate deaminase
MFNKLEIVAAFARGGDKNKNYLLMAMAERSDGAVVISPNALTKIPMYAAHAEARVLKKADANCILYVARVLRETGDWAISKPCPRCQALIRARHVKKVYYTIEPNKYGVWNVKKNEWFEVTRTKIC